MVGLRCSLVTTPRRAAALLTGGTLICTKASRSNTFCVEKRPWACHECDPDRRIRGRSIGNLGWPRLGCPGNRVRETAKHLVRRPEVNNAGALPPLVMCMEGCCFHCMCCFLLSLWVGRNARNTCNASPIDAATRFADISRISEA